MKTLVIAEYDLNGLRASTANVIGAAAKIGAPIDVVVAGTKDEKIHQAIASYAGVASVIVLESDALKDSLAEPLAKALLTIAKSYTHILAPATTFGKNVLPRLAALLGVGQISDVISIVSPTVFKRPIYAGNVIATVESLESIHLMTIRPTAFDGVASGGSTASIATQKVDGLTPSSTFIKLHASKSERPDLTSARIVISGGRALGSAENFKTFIEGLADDMGAAVGASRAAVDAGYVPNDYQVGQTGKVVAPELYMAIGISGAIQHLAGMKDSKIIVAINKDPDAPIFQIADYGLVGDLFEAIPELRKQLGLKRAS